MLKQIVIWSVVTFVAFYWITQPSGMVHLVHGLLGLLASVGGSLAGLVN